IIDGISENPISDFNFNHLFQHIFDESIIRVGFAWASDYYLIGNTFPFLKPLMQNEKRKSLCIKKLVEGILKNSEAEDAVFNGQKLSSVSLSKVSKAILGIELDKEMQRSDWTRRPLAGEQKLYAIIDAIVVILIEEKIRNALKKNLNATLASKIMEEGYVSMKQDKATIDELTKTFNNVSI
uniref:3'-5' exonuclease domain-containing protein n=1 Tax=Panagrolaimus sp. ES5 TaxID=591445 RepID=A0AC34G6Y4_9BILA